MEIIEPFVEIIYPSLREIAEFPKKLELMGRVCYKSEDRISDGSADKFIKMILKRGHESVLEHLSITVRIVCDRSTSHQLVRHRIAAYSQESQRFCNYAGNKKRDEGIQVICPPTIFANKEIFSYWENFVKEMEKEYIALVKLGVPAEDARSILGNCVKTEVVTTFNVRQWRHVFSMRCDSHAQWQIRGIMTSVLLMFYQAAPALFADKAEEFLGISKITLADGGETA